MVINAAKNLISLLLIIKKEKESLDRLNVSSKYLPFQLLMVLDVPAMAVTVTRNQGSIPKRERVKLRPIL